MPCSCKSSVSRSTTTSTITKPMSIFYIWYAELCRRSNSSPLAKVKSPKPKNNTVLDFTADRIKSEEWTPILNALRLDTSLHVIAIRNRTVGCKFLYEVNTEDRVRRMKRQCASLWTDYILRSLMRSLSCCVKNTQVLSTLELDGLPLSGEYFETLLPSLRNNRTIKILSFKHCRINDGGCQQLCVHLRFMPNVEVLNLSSCNLSSISGQHIAKVIKHQQINRYCESWHNSLRYSDPRGGIMAGLKRVTLNNNPDMGDEGLSYILDELDDDLWIKAIDMQKCNITENMSRRLIEVVEFSRSLEVADFRDNEQLSFATIEKILEVIEKKQQFGLDPEYQWCATTTTLYNCTTYRSSCTNMSGVSTNIQKSKSVPLRKLESTSLRPPIRRTKTLAMIDNKPRYNLSSLLQPNNIQLDHAKKQLSALNTKLQLEILKRKQTEKKNNVLQHKLEKIEKMGGVQVLEQQNKLANVIRLIEDMGLNDDEKAFPAIKEALSKRDFNLTPAKSKTLTTTPSTAKKRPKTPTKSVKEETRPRPKTPKMFAKEKKQQRPKTPKKVDKEKIVTDKAKKEKPANTNVEQKSIAQNIFERFLFKDSKDNEAVDEDELQGDNILNYYYDPVSEDDDPHSFQNIQLANAFDSDSPLTGSNASLERFLQDLNVVDEDLQFKENSSSDETTDRIFGRDSKQDLDKSLFGKFMVRVS